MGACSCLDMLKESLVDEKWAEIINGITRIESNVWCKYCKSKGKGLVIEDPESKCNKTCTYCQLEIKHTNDKENEIDEKSFESPRRYPNYTSPRKKHDSHIIDGEWECSDTDKNKYSFKNQHHKYNINSPNKKYK